MPIYAYRCTSCGHAKDVLRKISDPPLSICPACGAATFAKQVTAAGFQLKGSGWYVTDFRGDKNAKKPADASAAAPAGDAAAGPAGETAGAKPGAEATTGKSAGKPAGEGAAAKPATPAAAPAAPSGGTSGSSDR